MKSLNILLVITNIMELILHLTTKFTEPFLIP